MTLCVERVIPRPDDILILTRRGRDFRQLLGHGAAGDGHAVAVQQAVREQHLQHLRHAAGAVKINCHIFARRLEIAQHRHLAAHAFEVVDGPFHVGGMRNGQKVQHGVGRAAGGHDEGDRIFNRFARDDVARPQIEFDRIDQHGGGRGRRVGFFRVGRSHL